MRDDGLHVVVPECLPWFVKEAALTTPRSAGTTVLAGVAKLCGVAVAKVVMGAGPLVWLAKGFSGPAVSTKNESTEIAAVVELPGAVGGGVAANGVPSRFARTAVLVTERLAGPAAVAVTVVRARGRGW